MDRTFEAYLCPKLGCVKTTVLHHSLQTPWILSLRLLWSLCFWTYPPVTSLPSSTCPIEARSKAQAPTGSELGTKDGRGWIAFWKQSDTAAVLCLLELVTRCENNIINISQQDGLGKDM